MQSSGVKFTGNSAQEIQFLGSRVVGSHLERLKAVRFDRRIMRSGSVTNFCLQSAAVLRWSKNNFQVRFLMVGFAIYDLQPLLDLRFAAKLFSTLA